MARFKQEGEVVFLNANPPFTKVYDNGNSTTFRFLTVADPQTFENLDYSYDEKLDEKVKQFSRAEKVKLVIEARKSFKNTNHVVVDIFPATQK